MAAPGDIISGAQHGSVTALNVAPVPKARFIAATLGITASVSKAPSGRVRRKKTSITHTASMTPSIVSSVSCIHVSALPLAAHTSAARALDRRATRLRTCGPATVLRTTGPADGKPPPH